MINFSSNVFAVGNGLNEPGENFIGTHVNRSWNFSSSSICLVLHFVDCMVHYVCVCFCESVYQADITLLRAIVSPLNYLSLIDLSITECGKNWRWQGLQVRVTDMNIPAWSLSWGSARYVEEFRRGFPSQRFRLYYVGLIVYELRPIMCCHCGFRIRKQTWSTAWRVFSAFPLYPNAFALPAYRRILNFTLCSRFARKVLPWI